MAKAFSNKALPPGTVLREWRLEQVLGVGGFGIVYRGRGIYFDELVAIKEYFPSAISDRKDGDTVVPTDSAAEEVHALGLKKFVEEAKLLWNLSKPTRHPNIVSVRSLFEIHGTAYMVMDFEDGVSLSDLLRQGKTFSQESLLALLKPIAEGLDRAHRVGVLHRDIKPANILVSEDGRPVLIDFGSARFESGDATSTTVTFHTPPYAAIEQYVKTYSQGPWTDIYALGVAMYECITGTKPAEVLERLHGSVDKPLATQDIPGFSRAFLRAVDQAMIIRPGDRPQSIPQWLALFDLPDDADISVAADDAEATRFASFQTLPEEIIAVVPPVPVALETPALPEAANPPESAAPPVPATAAPAARPAREENPGRSRRGLVLAGGGALALLAAAGIGSLALRPGKETAAASVPAPAAAAGRAAASATVAPADLASAFDGLLADARKAGRPAAELASLGTTAGLLKQQADSLAGVTDPAALKAATDRMAGLVKPAAAGLNAALTKDAAQKAAALARSAPWADPRRPLALAGQTDAQKAQAQAAHQAFDDLTKASAAATAATNPLEAVAALRQGVVAASTLGQAGARLAALSPAARRADLVAATGRIRALGTEIAELAKPGRPGLFASREKRDSWKLRQDNAKRAQAIVAELDRQVAQATTPPAIERTLAAARRNQAELLSIKRASTAAMPAGN